MSWKKKDIIWSVKSCDEYNDRKFLEADNYEITILPHFKKEYGDDMNLISDEREFGYVDIYFERRIASNQWRCKFNRVSVVNIEKTIDYMFDDVEFKFNEAIKNESRN